MSRSTQSPTPPQDLARLTLIYPPWFGDELTMLGADYFRGQGFDVVATHQADLPNDPRCIETDEVVAWVANNVTEETQAVFLGGNGFRAVSAIARLEQLLTRPVLTSNQVLLWSLLDSTRCDVDVRAYGSLFVRRPPTRP